MALRWTEYEMKILRSVYPKKGYRLCLSFLHDRTKQQIQVKAKALGIKREFWSHDELVFMRSLRGLDGSKVALFEKKFPNVHSSRSIERLVTCLHIGRKYNKWSSEKDDFLRKVYSCGGFKSFTQKYGSYTCDSVHNRAHKLGLQCRLKSPWLVYDLNFLREFYPTKGGIFCANQLKRSKHSVWTKAYRLGLDMPVRGISQSGVKAPNWQGGLAYQPYPNNFNRLMRHCVRLFFNERCLNCGCEQVGRKLSVHHIDYIKNNVFFENLVPLCVKCHGKTMMNHAMWIERLIVLRDEFHTNFLANYSLLPFLKDYSRFHYVGVD